MKDRRQFLKQSLLASVALGVPLSAIQDCDRAIEANEQMYLDAVDTIRQRSCELGKRAFIERTLEALLPFEDWAQCALYCSVSDENADTRLLAVHCMVTDYQEFDEYLELFPDLLDHVDPTVNQAVPRLLWRFQARAKFAIPKLQEHLCDTRPWFRVSVAKAIGIIEPNMLEDAIPIVERSVNDPVTGEYARNVLAQMKGEKPYMGL